jgi:Zn-dependent protease with chaperone function
MSSRAWLFGLVLVIPLIGFAASEGMQAHLNSQLRSALRANFPNADPAEIARVNLDQLCKEHPGELGAVCGTNTILNLVSSASVWAAAIGLILLAGIRLAGAWARSDRRLLLYVFRPGLYLTALTLLCLVPVHAFIAMATIYYGESTLINRVHVVVILGIGLGAVIGVLAIVQSILAVLRKARTVVIGFDVASEAAPALWREVSGLSETLGSLSPDHIIVGLDPNFFVTEAHVACLNGTMTGRTLYCSLPLMRILSPGELRAVIGHELGHFKGADTQFSQQFFPIYRGSTQALAALQEAAEGARAIAILPAIAIFGYFLECFAVAERGISRQRELAADAEGARATSPSEIATSLVKIHAFTGLWDALRQAAAGALRGGKAFVNASKTYADAVGESAKPEALEGIADTHLSHPTDTHPPLGVRLEALGLTLAELTGPSLEVGPDPAAITLLPDAEKLEEELSGAYQAIMAQELGITPTGPAERAESDA